MENDSDWHPLGAILYRKWAAYAYKEENAALNQTKLEEYTICGAPYGGPIALVSLPISTASTSAQRVLISSSAGQKLADVQLIHESNVSNNSKEKVVVGVGWTNQEHLVTVIDDGD